MNDPATHPNVIVGLGNPGPEYERTRHNAGFLVIDELAQRYDVQLRKDKQSQHGKLSAASSPSNTDLHLLKPLTYMNLSGTAVQAALTRTRTAPQHLLVIHDDIDLPLGKLRYKQNGSAGGQRGVADIIKAIGPNFARLKVGVGRPPERWSTQNWVLSRFTPAEQTVLADVIRAATDSVEDYLKYGLEHAMNATNGLDLTA